MEEPLEAKTFAKFSYAHLSVSSSMYLFHNWWSRRTNALNKPLCPTSSFKLGKAACFLAAAIPTFEITSLLWVYCLGYTTVAVTQSQLFFPEGHLSLPYTSMFNVICLCFDGPCPPAGSAVIHHEVSWLPSGSLSDQKSFWPFEAVIPHYGLPGKHLEPEWAICQLPSTVTELGLNIELSIINEYLHEYGTRTG